MQVSSYFKYRFLLFQITLFHLSKLNTASTPSHHTLNCFLVYECKFRLVHNNATCILRDKPARKNTQFYWRNKKRTNYNIQGSVKSQQAREVTDPRRLQISNCIIGTSHILLLQKQKKMKNVLTHGKDPHRGARTVSHVTHKLRSAEHEIMPLSIKTISLVFPQIIQILDTWRYK